jgi:hypothetical protein
MVLTLAGLSQEGTPTLKLAILKRLQDNKNLPKQFSDNLSKKFRQKICQKESSKNLPKKLPKKLSKNCQKIVKQSNTKNSTMRKMTTIIRIKSDKTRFLEASLIRKRMASLKIKIVFGHINVTLKVSYRQLQLHATPL